MKIGKALMWPSHPAIVNSWKSTYKIDFYENPHTRLISMRHFHLHSQYSVLKCALFSRQTFSVFERSHHNLRETTGRFQIYKPSECTTLPWLSGSGCPWSVCWCQTCHHQRCEPQHRSLSWSSRQLAQGDLARHGEEHTGDIFDDRIIF